MSVLIQAALTCVLFAVPGAQQPTTPSGAPKPPAAVPTRADTPAPATSAVPQPSTAPIADPSADPVLKALRAEVERLQKAAADAEAAAADDTGRLRARTQLNTELLLVVIRLQEQLYLQHKALLAAAGTARPPARTSGGASTASQAGSTKPKYVGPVFAKRGGSGKAHRPGCAFGEKIAPAERVTFGSVAQAETAGCEPCKVCRP